MKQILVFFAMAVVSAMISFDFSKTVEHISKLSSFAFLWGRPWHAAAVFYEWAKKDSLGLISWVGVAFSNSGNSGQKDAWSFPLYNNFNVFSKNEIPSSWLKDYGNWNWNCSEIHSKLRLLCDALSLIKSRLIADLGTFFIHRQPGL